MIPDLEYIFFIVKILIGLISASRIWHFNWNYAMQINDQIHFLFNCGIGLGGWIYWLGGITWFMIIFFFSVLQASFPGTLHLVLVLRPTSFFQRTFTDLVFRFSQEDFMLNLPVRPSTPGLPSLICTIYHNYPCLYINCNACVCQVVMLSSVTDLLRYIDENQLTSEFGGTLDYSHSDWIFLRTVQHCYSDLFYFQITENSSCDSNNKTSLLFQAIESFAVTVKDIAQMLQAFGTELAEMELSQESNAIELLLLSHTEKYRKLKVQLKVKPVCVVCVCVYV